MRLSLPALVLCLLVADARADKATADALVKEGIARAKAGKYDEAIAKFKEADAAFPRASHDCNVGIAYDRMGETVRAAFFLARCRERAGGKLSSDEESLVRPVEKRLATTLADGAFAKVVLKSDPPDVTATVQALGDDVVLAPPVTIWLPLGTHTFKTTAGGKTSEVKVTLEENRTRLVTLTVSEPETTPPIETPPEDPVEVEPPRDPVEPPRDPVEIAPPVAVRPPVERPSRVLPYTLLGVGAAALATGLVFTITALDAQDEAASTTDIDVWQDAVDTMALHNKIFVISYAVGVAALAGGIYLLVTEEKPRGVRAGPHDAGLGVGPGKVSYTWVW